MLIDADWLSRATTQRVFTALERDGHVARVVGGAVRNAIMGLPVVDVDIATTATPDVVVDFARAGGLDCVPTGLKHGTVTVIADHVPFEVTTLRQDVETFGRHAEVAFTRDWEADARRRDFTMNALYCDKNGVIYDPLDGYGDVVARRVKFVGVPEDRIREDYLRILRFFRFFAEYGAGDGQLDAGGLRACIRLRNGLATLSAERVRQELMRLLAATNVMAALEQLFDAGLLSAILGRAPRFASLARLVRLERALGIEVDAVARLGLLAVEVPEDGRGLAERLRLSKAEGKALNEIASANRAFGVPFAIEPAKKILYEIGPSSFRRGVLTGWARAGAPEDDNSWRALFDLPNAWRCPEFPINGGDIVALGLLPGPAVGTFLRQLEAEWVAGGFVGDRDQLLALAKAKLSRS